MTDLLERPQSAAPVVARPAHVPGPRCKPPMALRAVAGLGGVLVSLFTVALMLSDRAPGLVEQLFGDRARRLWERVDASGRADFVTADRVPESDNLVHIAVWALVMVLVGVTVWSWRWLVISAPLVLGASAVIEVGQGRWAETRGVETSDVVANGTGVALGVVLAMVLYICWSALAALFAPRSPRRS